MSLLKHKLIHPWAGFALAFIVLVLDLFTKYLASEAFTLNERMQIWPFFDLTLRHNYGAAFSFLSDQGGWQVWFFGLLAGTVSVVLIVWICRLPKHKLLEMFGLSLILGGALGNLYDRVTLGYVVDFILFYYEQHQFPAFNIADTGITIGAVMLILDYILESRQSRQSEQHSVH